MLMNDANWQNQLLLQAISKCLTPVTIDSEIGTATGNLVGANPLLTYVRYEAELQIDALAKLGVEVSRKRLDSLRDMSDAEHRQQLFEIGQAVASRDVHANHFPSTFSENLPE